MFRLRLRGAEAHCTLGCATAAVFRSWTVQRAGTGWTLTGRVSRVDLFLIERGPRNGLRFNAPRVGGYWSWPVQAATVARDTLTATLGPPDY